MTRRPAIFWDLLVAKKFRVLEFRQTKANLEDIFMTVTKGGVQ